VIERVFAALLVRDRTDLVSVVRSRQRDHKVCSVVEAARIAATVDTRIADTVCVGQCDGSGLCAQSCCVAVVGQAIGRTR
jgi:hypothetical protein